MTITTCGFLPVHWSYDEVCPVLPVDTKPHAFYVSLYVPDTFDDQGIMTVDGATAEADFLFDAALYGVAYAYDMLMFLGCAPSTSIRMWCDVYPWDERPWTAAHACTVPRGWDIVDTSTEDTL